MSKAQKIGSLNVSKGKKAIQSSFSKTSAPDEANRALVGVQDKPFSFETSGGDFPFWQVDLGQVYPLEEIKVFNRRDDFQHRARSLTVEVSENRRDWTVVHSGTLYWDGAVSFPLGGVVRGRLVRIRLQERLRLHLDRVEVFARNYEDYGAPAFLACRTDGLGERLNALLNAIWLSRVFKCDFRFDWPKRFLDDPDHAIASLEDTFTADFIAKHYAVRDNTDAVWELSGTGRTLPDVTARLARTGLIRAPRLHPLDIMVQEPELMDPLGLKNAFDSIGFAPPIAQAISDARSIELPEGAVALHLRSGDVFFGEYRKFLHYTYKGLTLPFAKMVIGHYRALGREVYIFGQDPDSISYLCKTCGAHDANQINPEARADMTRVQRAMFDLVLLSRFKLIVGGSSGFIRQAGWVGGSEVLVAHKLFPAGEQTKNAVFDLYRNARSYHPLQAAIGFWYAYFYGRQHRKNWRNIFLLRKAIRWDPDNELYYFVLAAHLAQDGKMEKANAVLHGLFRDRKKKQSLETIFQIFTAMTGSKYNLAEYLPDLEKLSQTSFYAAILMMAQSSHSKNATDQDRYKALAEKLSDQSDLSKDSLKQATSF